MGLSLRGTTSGAVDINAPAVAGDNTITLPGTNGAANQFYKNSGTAGIVTHSSMVEDSSGLVGIGLTNPGALLHLESNGVDAARLRIGFDSTRYYDIFRGSISNGGYLNFYGSQTGFTGYIFDGVDGERLRITPAGNVGIGTDNPTQLLQLESAAPRMRLIDSDVSTGGQVSGSNGNLSLTYDVLGVGGKNFSISDSTSTRLLIDSSGRLLIGLTAARTGFFNVNAISPLLQVETNGPTDDGRFISLVSNPGASAGYSPTFLFGKSRSTATGGTTGVANNDELGAISWQGADGSGLVEAARIAALVDGVTGTDDIPGRLVFSTTADGASSPTERMRITSSGLIQSQLNSKYLMQFSNGVSSRVPIIEFQSSSTSSGAAQNYIVADIAATHGGAFVNPNVSIRVASGSYGASGMVDRLICNAVGVVVNGSFSKTSGSFRIDHPLESKSATHDLVHSFIEGPQADNIYRGVVTLIDGSATIDIDQIARMTTGTFVALNTNVSCFTSNETDWTPVRGSVSGSTLTIEAQDNTSTATVSWMVVGERHDQHMIDTAWTDENGRVITEPLKSE